MLRKFWEVNKETAKKLKTKKVIAAKIKEDGSIARFIKLPSGKIIGKSMFSFDSSQAEALNNILAKNDQMSNFVEECLTENIAPIFELVGPENQVVLKYEEEELLLLQMRCEKTGKLLNLNHPLVDKYKIKTANECAIEKNIEYYMDLARTERGYEGFVLTFEDGSLIKVKLDEYKYMHGIMTSLCNQEHKICKLSLLDLSDDQKEGYSSFERYMKITKISKEHRRYARNINKAIGNYIEDNEKEILSLLDECKDLNMKESKEIMKNYKHSAISMRVKACDIKTDIRKLLIQEVLKSCKTADKASSFMGRSLKMKTIKRKIPSWVK